MKNKYLLITGGTGGHVIPAENLGNYLLNKKLNCRIIIDKRGRKYLNNFKGKILIVESSNLNGNIFLKILGIFKLFFGFIQSLFLIFYFKPNKVISFGSYASFFPMFTCIILKPFLNIEIFIHEQNSIFGRTNRFFMNFTKKIFLNFNNNLLINKKFKNKIFIVGSPEKNFINYQSIKNKNVNKKFTIFIFGGSQGSEYISKFSLKIIKLISQENIIKAKFIIQSPNNMIDIIYDELKNINSDFIIKDYYKNIDEILLSSSLVISRAGAGTINDLINFKLPSILVPLTSSKDNHQYFNAFILKKNDLAIIIDENKNEIKKAKEYIYRIYNNANNVKLIEDKFNKIKVKNSNSIIYKLMNNEK